MLFYLSKWWRSQEAAEEKQHLAKKEKKKKSLLGQATFSRGIIMKFWTGESKIHELKLVVLAPMWESLKTRDGKKGVSTDYLVPMEEHLAQEESNIVPLWVSVDDLRRIKKLN